MEDVGDGDCGHPAKCGQSQTLGDELADQPATARAE